MSASTIHREAKITSGHMGALSRTYSDLQVQNELDERFAHLSSVEILPCGKPVATKGTIGSSRYRAGSETRASLSHYSRRCDSDATRAESFQ